MAGKNAPVSVKSFVGVKRTENVLMVDPAELHIIPGFNPRSNLGDLETLATQIEQYGVLTPLSVWEKEGRLFVIGGHRRKGALDLLASRGVHIKLVPCVLEPAKLSESELLVRAFLGNEGERLSNYDEANLYRRFMAHGDTLADVAKRVGKSETIISGRLDLLQAEPDMVRELQAGKIGVTLLLKAIKEAEKNGTTQKTAVEKIKTANPDLRGSKAKAAKKAAEEQKAAQDAQARQAEIDAKAEVLAKEIASQSQDMQFNSAIPALPPVVANDAPSTAVVASGASTPSNPTPEANKPTPALARGVNVTKPTNLLKDIEDDNYATLVESGFTEAAQALTLPYPRLKAYLSPIFSDTDYPLVMILTVLVERFGASPVSQALGQALQAEHKRHQAAKAKPLTPGAAPMVVTLGKPGSAQAAFADADKSKTETTTPTVVVED
jgi:ParB/RepB/Spo0J family partition protein